MRRKEILNIVLVILGSFLIAIGVNVFLLPNKISTGGATGIATIIYYLYNIPVSILVLVINFPLFVIALKNIGFKFCTKALIGTTMLAIFIHLTQGLKHISWLDMSGDLFLGSIFGGIMLGIGNSLVFKGEGSTGGSDLLAQIIYKKRMASSLGQIILSIDALIILTTIIAFKNLDFGLYSVVAIYLSKKTVDILFEGVSRSKVITIISKNGNKLADEIIKKTDRGVTINTPVIGKYTGEKYDEVMCVVNTSEIPKVKRIIKEIDEKAFTYISNTTEVLGIGFKRVT